MNADETARAYRERLAAGVPPHTTQADYEAHSPVDHELDAWLDGALDHLTEEQRAEFGCLVRAYTATQAGRGGEDADYAEEDNAAWTAALMQACGQNDVAARGRAYREAQRTLYASAMIASLAGGSEVQVARDATISRNTLRQLLRKTPR